jgi:Fe-S cluster assembly protein SufD
MNLVLAKTDTGRAVNSVFAVARDRLPGAGKVADIRRQAFEAYERIGLPHRRIEEWKYTDLRALMREVLPLAAAPDAKALKRARAVVAAHAVDKAAKLVLVDGVFVPELSDIAALGRGVAVRTLSEVLANETNDARGDLLITNVSDPMLSLNAALATDGVVVTIADGTALSHPIQLFHVATTASASSVTRSHVSVGKGSRATLVESFVAAEGAKAYQRRRGAVAGAADGGCCRCREHHVTCLHGRHKGQAKSVQHDQRRPAQSAAGLHPACR